MGEWNITDPTFSMDVCAHVCGIRILDWVSESAETTYNE